MENALYTTIARQSGLMREMVTVANNIANVSTTGFRREGVVFAEHIMAVEGPGGSLSMAKDGAHITSSAQGALKQTGGTLDFAIEGEGYFVIDTPAGQRLTRAGAFSMDNNGLLVALDGYPVLDNGGAPIFVPPDLGPLSAAGDGTLSTGDVPLAQLGIVVPNDPDGMVREDGVRFNAPEGFVEVGAPAVAQGFLEASNVNAVSEITRMIEVQRAYEMGQRFIEREDERITAVIDTLGRG